MAGGRPRRSRPGLALGLTFVAWATALPPGSAMAQDREPAVSAPVTLERIMSHPEWLGRAPQRPYWDADGRSVYTYRAEPVSDGLDPRDFELFQIGLDGTVLRKVEPRDYPDVGVASGTFDRDRSRRLVIRHGDLYLERPATGSRAQLTRTTARESDPFFLADGRIGFSRAGQVFVRDLESGLELQLFDLRAEQDPIEARNETRRDADYLARQQDRLLEWIRDEEARRRRSLEQERSDRADDPSRVPPPFYLGEKRRVRRISASPSGVAALVTTTAERGDEPRREKMPQYVTASGWVEPRDVRPKVGSAPPAETLVLITLDDHRLRRIELDPLPGINEDPLAELKRAARERARERKSALDPTEPKEGLRHDTEAESDDRGAARAAPEKDDETEGEPKPRPVRVGQILWNRSGDRAVVDLFALDHKDRWLALVRPDHEQLVSLHRIHDDAWINWRFRQLGWLDDDRTIFLLSEETGFSQLYTLDTEHPGEPRRLTHTDAVVDGVELAPDGRSLFFTANPLHPGRYEVYRADLASGRIEQITDLGGLNEFVLSPDGMQLLLTHSTTTRPPELWLQEARPGAPARQLTHTISDEFLAIDWSVPEIVEVPSSHVGRPIFARLYRARSDRGLNQHGQRPAVVFVHGAGYLQNAHQGWSGYFREFMFHTLLTQHGYVVLDMDYRASAGYGRDWRTAIYRHMGKPEVEDLQDGVRFLVEHEQVDADRIGVYGGSYGGFLTFMAMFTEPDLFAAGAALRPVTDWAHYNHPYTSNILNTPDVDPEAYERSSPIELAEGLSKPLLIATGMLDDNVFFMDSVRLVQRLIELEKQHWEIAIYPVEPHGFREPASWLDEYRRIFALFEENLQP